LSIRSILTGLLHAKVDFVVVGMTAGQLHGSRLLTEDIDIVYKQDSQNITRLTSYFQSIDARVYEHGRTQAPHPTFLSNDFLPKKA